MSLGVLNNISAIYAQNSLSNTQGSLSKTLQQLSSGSRINSGADDAAGLAVADGLAANSTALAQSAKNASDAIGLLQTADGALSQVTTLLNRAVTLATQAGNGTLSGSQISSANQEYQNILTQINNIGNTTNFNGTAVFSNTSRSFFVSDGTTSGSTSYNDVVGSLSTTSVGTSGYSTSTPTVANGTTAAYSTSGTAGTVTVALGSGSSDTFSGNLTVSYGGSNVSMSVAAGTTKSNLVATLNASGGAFATAGITASLSGNTLTLTGATPTGTGDVAGKALITASSGNTFEESTPVAAGSVGSGTNLSTVAIDSSANARSVLTNLTSAIANVAYQRGSIGANINQLSSAQSVASNEQTNLTAAEDNIRATDYGQAASNLSKYQVLSQTGISALAQANSVQQEVLKLLQ